MMVAGSAATAEPAPTPSETKLVELLVQPERWFIEQLGGKRVVVDGQTLDPKIQYVLARDAAAPKPSGPAVDPAATPEGRAALREGADRRSEEHTSELQSLMRISYAVFCLKKKKKPTHTRTP